MKKFKSILITLATLTLTFSAFINAASACGFWHHQPKLPKALRK